MEAVFYFLDVGIMVLACYWLVKMGARKPGEPTSGLFAYYETLPTKSVNSKKDNLPLQTTVAAKRQLQR